MSIDSFLYCRQRRSSRSTVGILTISALAWLTGATHVFCDDAPVEPEEIVIVSDEGDENPQQPAAPAAESEQSPKANDQNQNDKEVPSSNKEDDSESESEKDAQNEASEEQIDEVAPIRNRVTAAHPRITQADKDAETLPDDVAEEEEGTPGIIHPAQRARSQSKPAKPLDEDSEHAPEELPEAAADAPVRPLVEGASFKGVLPDITTVEEMQEAWGPAKEIRKTQAGTQYIHYLKPFKQVVATVTNDKVDTIIIHLDRLFEPTALAKQLKLDDIEPATIYNSNGQMLGRAFPERGVLFGFASGSPVRVAQIVVEPINSQPFVTRAENKYNSSPSEALVDIEYAIDLDPEYDRAHAMHAKVFWELGQLDAALLSSEKSLALVPHEADPRLTRAKVLLYKQEYDRAEAELQKLANDDQAAPIIRADARYLLGNARAAGPARAFNEAVKHHTEAIKMAEEVAANSAGPIRRWAKELLVDAHLAVANDIAWGHWQQKQKVVPKWIDRANSFCNNLLTQDPGTDSARLRVYMQTLHAYAGMQDAPDVSKTIDAMADLGRELAEKESNAARRQILSWSLGEAMISAMLIAQSQGKIDAATQFGQQALTHFEQSGKIGEAWPSRELIVGKAYYRLGVIQAVDKAEHSKAIAWYDKAAPLLEAPVRPSAAADPGRLGEIFVSMAVSYWDTGSRDEAIRLTQQGVKLMESAVSEDLLSESALAVPYGNLASMHAEMGNPEKSKQFAEMASRHETVRK